MEKHRIEGDYRQFMDKSFIGEWDLPEKEDLIVEIDHAEINEVKSERGTEEKLCVHFRGGYKPLIINATNGAAIKDALGTARVEQWRGQRLSLYRERVSAFGKTTMAVRVRPYPPKTEEYICQDCGCMIEASGNYTARQIAGSSRSQFGRTLCMSCAKAAKTAKEQIEKEGDVLGEDNED